MPGSIVAVGFLDGNQGVSFDEFVEVSVFGACVGEGGANKAAGVPSGDGERGQPFGEDVVGVGVGLGVGCGVGAAFAGARVGWDGMGVARRDGGGATGGGERGGRGVGGFVGVGIPLRGC